MALFILGLPEKTQEIDYDDYKRCDYSSQEDGKQDDAQGAKRPWIATPSNHAVPQGHQPAGRRNRPPG